MPRSLIFFIIPLRLPPGTPLFPYTTLFRSQHAAPAWKARHRQRRAGKDAERRGDRGGDRADRQRDRKSTRLNSSHTVISYAVFCLKKKNARRAPALARCLVGHGPRHLAR